MRKFFTQNGRKKKNFRLSPNIWCYQKLLRFYLLWIISIIFVCLSLSLYFIFGDFCMYYYQMENFCFWLKMKRILVGWFCHTVVCGWYFCVFAVGCHIIAVLNEGMKALVSFAYNFIVDNKLIISQYAMSISFQISFYMRAWARAHTHTWLRVSDNFRPPAKQLCVCAIKEKIKSADIHTTTVMTII